MKIFEIFLKTFQQIVFFIQTREKQMHGLLTFLKTCSNNSCEAIFLRNLLKNFEKFSQNFPQFGFSSQRAKNYRKVR